MTNRNYRYWQFLLILATMFVLMASFYFEFVEKLPPCPLCLMQRFSIMILLALLMMEFFLGLSRRGKPVVVFHLIIAVAGLYFAGRQIWLMSLPPGKTPACLPGLDVLIHYFPWQDVVRALFLGAGDCAETRWQWLGLSMPAWAAMYFIGMFLAGLVNYHLLSRFSKLVP
ncbi:disulfide bond formation protein B [Legionella spiritensis]|uniref:Disulfide bond formation protein B n=1 Tax=Legionella spiritensis TaxID=452 RepID=A0A0W0Z5G2_LEGSP|nr:disulfide bond formation protein B [Legionella spiritensis]KTD64354.1 disulfide bond formation protein DsbB [Legionella spiritensis]SNV46367.1 disulfide bond formation protein DsbB [Legionella spiritensis]